MKAEAGLLAVALACGCISAKAAVPTASSVQQAYERARNDPDSNPQHIYALDITHTLCTSISGSDRFACQIDFVRHDSPNERLYFDVVTVGWQNGQWVLLSGLCKGSRATSKDRQ